MPSSSQVMLVLLVPATLQTNVTEKLQKYWDSLIKVVYLCLAQVKALSLWLYFHIHHYITACYCNFSLGIHISLRGKSERGRKLFLEISPPFVYSSRSPAI